MRSLYFRWARISAALALIVPFRFQLHNIYSLVNRSEFLACLCTAKDHRKTLSRFLHPSLLLPYFHCPVAQLLDTSVSTNSDLGLLNLLGSLFFLWAHLPSAVIQKILPGRNWEKHGAYFVWFSLKNHSTALLDMQCLKQQTPTFCPVLYCLWQEGKSGTNYSITVRSRSLSN